MNVGENHAQFGTKPCHSEVTPFYEINFWSAVHGPLVYLLVGRFVHKRGPDPIEGDEGTLHKKTRRFGRTKDGFDVPTFPTSR